MKIKIILLKHQESCLAIRCLPVNAMYYNTIEPGLEKNVWDKWISDIKIAMPFQFLFSIFAGIFGYAMMYMMHKFFKNVFEARNWDEIHHLETY